MGWMLDTRGYVVAWGATRSVRFSEKVPMWRESFWEFSTALSYWISLISLAQYREEHSWERRRQPEGEIGWDRVRWDDECWDTRWITMQVDMTLTCCARFPQAVLNGLRAEKTGRAELVDLMTTFASFATFQSFLWYCCYEITCTYATDTMLFSVSIWSLQNPGIFCYIPYISSYYPHLSSMANMFEASHCGGQAPRAQSRGACRAAPARRCNMEFPCTARPCQTPGRSPLPTPKRTVLCRPCSWLLEHFERVEPFIGLSFNCTSGGFGDRNTDSP